MEILILCLIVIILEFYINRRGYIKIFFLHTLAKKSCIYLF